MNDIYDIQGMLLGFPISVLGVVIFCVCILFSLAIYFFVFRNHETTLVTSQDFSFEKKDYLGELKKIERDTSMSDVQFLEQLLSLFREFLSAEKGYRGIETQTLIEIKQRNDIPKKYLDVLENMYQDEYTGTPLDSYKRSKYVEEVRKNFY